MKYIVVIGDGMADDPVPELGNRTPLQVARHPFMDALAGRGFIGGADNCPAGLPAGSETGILSIFGCDPLKYYTGRSPMEAAACGIELKPGDTCFRCNLVTMEGEGIPYEEKRIASYNAGSIFGEDALGSCRALLEDEEFSTALREYDMEFYPSENFRPILIWHNSDISGLKMAPPHDHIGDVCGDLFPKGSRYASRFERLMRIAHRVLAHHPISEKRKAAGMKPATGIWIWAEGNACALPSFEAEFGCTGAVVSAVPLCHGIGALRGMEPVFVEGATGELDTNFPGKLEAAKQSLLKHDFLCLHLEAPDECSHDRDICGKLKAIEWLDSRLVAPLVGWLDQRGEEYRILVLPDHKTLLANRLHAGGEVPFLLCDSRVNNGNPAVYNEEAVSSGALHMKGENLLKLLFNTEVSSAEQAG